MSVRPSADANGIHQILAAVANDGLERHGDANLVELLRKEKRVGVLPVRGEHLRADGDDFRFHKSSFQLLASSFQLCFRKCTGSLSLLCSSSVTAETSETS